MKEDIVIVTVVMELTSVIMRERESGERQLMESFMVFCLSTLLF